MWEPKTAILQKFTAAGWSGGAGSKKLQKTIPLNRVKAELGYSAACLLYTSEIGMVDERIHVLDHQLQTRVDIVREPFAAQNARQHALAVEDVLPQQQDVYKRQSYSHRRKTVHSYS